MGRSRFFMSSHFGFLPFILLTFMSFCCPPFPACTLVRSPLVFRVPPLVRVLTGCSIGHRGCLRQTWRTVPPLTDLERLLSLFSIAWPPLFAVSPVLNPPGFLSAFLLALDFSHYVLFHYPFTNSSLDLPPPPLFPCFPSPTAAFFPFCPNE